MPGRPDPVSLFRASGPLEVATALLLGKCPQRTALLLHLRVGAAELFEKRWRLGQADVAIGCAGIGALDDWRGRADEHGRALSATAIAVADQLAAAADLVRDKDSAVPGAVISGLAHLVTDDDGPGASAQQRPPGDDLFR